SGRARDAGRAFGPSHRAGAGEKDNGQVGHWAERSAAVVEDPAAGAPHTAPLRCADLRQVPSPMRRCALSWLKLLLMARAKANAAVPNPLFAGSWSASAEGLRGLALLL